MGTLQRIAAFLLKLVLSASQCDSLVKLLDKRFAYYDNSAQDVNRGSRIVAVQGLSRFKDLAALHLQLASPVALLGQGEKGT